MPLYNLATGRLLGPQPVMVMSYCFHVFPCLPVSICWHFSYIWIINTLGNVSYFVQFMPHLTYTIGPMFRALTHLKLWNETTNKNFTLHCEDWAGMCFWGIFKCSFIQKKTFNVTFQVSSHLFIVKCMSHLATCLRCPTSMEKTHFCSYV